ncbi:hypothetical protein [Lachnospira sp.]|uniref:hypothetical protein n=1 Tax=Lachnospira sp. TaxID=2049031 RepID=UPI00257D4E99|nr:hypothetical protein [Lachnospira sp.]
MNNCKPTIIINNVEYASEKRIDSSSSLEAIVQSLLADPQVFASIKEALNNPLNGTANLESFNDLVHVIPSNSDLNKVTEFLGTTGRTYQPVLYSI